MKNIGFAVLGAMALLPATSQAQEISGNVALASEYVYRGIAQTDGMPAIQGGFDFAQDIFYAGVWASNVEFGDGTSIETDFYAGFTPSVGGFDLDIGALYYGYPGSPDAGGEQDFLEVYAGIGRGYDAISWDAKVSYSSDFYLEVGPAWYREVGLAFQAAENLSFDARFGSSVFDDAPAGDYEDYQVGATVSGFGVDWDLRWYDTTVSDSLVVVSVSMAIGG
jgi:uncharacterized protein (TIGR02001 family)